MIPFRNFPHPLYKNAIKNRKFSLLPALNAFEYVGSSNLNPATLFAHTLEGLNSISGLGWPGTIVAFTLGMRLILFPYYIKQNKATITASNLKDEVNGYQSRIQNYRSNNQFAEAKEELQNITISLSLLPIPFFMSSFFALRNMSSQPIESFLQGGYGWFLNLAESDPFYILPIISCGTLLASFEASRKSNPAAIPAKMVNFIRLLSLISVPILAHMPASLCIYFISTNLFTLVQNAALSFSKIRSLLGIPKLALNPPKQNSGFFQSLKENYLKFTEKSNSKIIIHSTRPLKNSLT